MSGVRQSQPLTVRPVGRVEGGRDDWHEDRWRGVEATIRLDADRFEPSATQGLDDFSHLEAYAKVSFG